MNDEIEINPYRIKVFELVVVVGVNYSSHLPNCTQKNSQGCKPKWFISNNYLKVNIA
jgi:hypothetical protein